jgi:hypothetical protein
MHVPLEILRRAVLLVDGLAELDDPAGFGDMVSTIPGCSAAPHGFSALATLPA